MIDFTIKDKKIELSDYSANTTLPKLVASLEEFRITNNLRTRNCKGCGQCCQDNIPVLGFDIPILTTGLNCSLEEVKHNFLIIPEPIDAESRYKSINEMTKTTKMSKIDATLLYEYNNAEPLILNKQINGDCCFLNMAYNCTLSVSTATKLYDVQKRPSHSKRPPHSQNSLRLCSQYSCRPFSCGLYLCNMGEKLSFLQEMIIRQGTWHAYSMLGWISEECISHNPFLKAKSYDELLVKDFDYQLQSALDQLFFYF